MRSDFTHPVIASR